MKVGQLLEQRRATWYELEQLCEKLRAGGRRGLTAEEVSRFAALYRSACADLALAEAYHLPPNTVHYLHRLVGRAHNQLYRERGFDAQRWLHTLLVETPQKLFNDVCVQVAFCVFWGVFILSAILAHSPTMWPGFAEAVVGEEHLEQMRDMYDQPLSGRDWHEGFFMAAFYIWNNTWIGLQCFAFCLTIVPGLLVLVYNAVALGATFGYMFRPDVEQGVNFREFVMAHGPFELTAIVLSAAAGLRIGLSLLMTRGLRRIDAIQQAGREAMPIMGAAMVLFGLAALIEAFVSPSGLPWVVKAAVALLCSAMLAFYFVVLGFPRGD